MVSGELLNLLRAHSTNSIVGRCMRAIEEDEIKFSPPTSLPLDRVLDVYSVRAKINSERNEGSIAGFEDLVLSINQAPKTTLVRLESWELLSKWFTIFTGEEYSVLFGVLESPKRKVAWFDPVRGYDY